MATWSEAFTAYLRKLGLSQLEARDALRRARIRITPSQVSYYARGAAYPRAQKREQIERWSKGEVRADLPRTVLIAPPDIEDASLHARAG